MKSIQELIIKEKSEPKIHSANLQRYFAELMFSLEKFENEDIIMQSEFKKLNETFGRIFEIAIDVIRSNIGRSYENEATGVEHTIFFEAPMGVTGLNKYIKILSKADLTTESQSSKDILNFTTTMIHDLINERFRIQSLKEKIGKKISKKEVKENENKKLSTHADSIFAQNFLAETIEQFHVQIVKQNTENLLSLYRSIKDAVAKDNNVFIHQYMDKTKNTAYQHRFNIVNILEVYTRSKENPSELIVKDDNVLNEQISKISEESFQFAKAKYVIDTSNKVGFILNYKNNLSSIKPLDIKPNGQIEAHLLFTFKDESSFQLSTNVEWVCNSNMTQFNRVPTRFHKIITPDGKLHTNVSEKIANDLFTLDYPQNKSINYVLKSKGAKIQHSKNKSDKKTPSQK